MEYAFPALIVDGKEVRVGKHERCRRRWDRWQGTHSGIMRQLPWRSMECKRRWNMGPGEGDVMGSSASLPSFLGSLR